MYVSYILNWRQLLLDGKERKTSSFLAEVAIFFCQSLLVGGVMYQVPVFSDFMLQLPYEINSNLPVCDTI